MAALPANYAFNLRRLTGYGRNNYKIHSSTTSSNMKAGSSTSFDIPSNVLCDLRSFKLYCTVELSAGGVQLSHGCMYYNRVCQALSIADANDCDKGMVQSVSHYSNDTYTTTSGETRRVCIRNLPGLLSNGSVSVLDTSLLPDIRVTIYWAPNAVLSKSAGIGDSDFIQVHASVSSSFTIDDCFATIDTISIASDV
eukprot:6188501-Pleurochrysis_carterae.AAC.3